MTKNKTELKAVNLLEIQRQYIKNRDLKPMSAIIYTSLLKKEGLI